MNKHSPVVQAVAIGVGAALYFLLARFVSIPSPIPNTSITFQYAVLAVVVVLFGPVSGAIAGFVGHILADATGYGVWISWGAGHRRLRRRAGIHGAEQPGR